MDSSVKVLVVGAGAVGQVYGWFLKQSGAEVFFYVKPKHRAEARKGFDLYPLNTWKEGEAAQHWKADGVLASPADLAGHAFQQVYLAIPSTGVEGNWLPAFVKALGEHATVVSLMPSPDDHAHVVAAGLPQERLVAGLISMVSYLAPLEGETRFAKPGVAYYLPPLAPSLYSGDQARTAEVVKRLNQGGLPARAHKDVPGLVAFPTGALMSYLAALELAGWSLRGLFQDARRLDLGVHAAGEALKIAAKDSGRFPFFFRTLTHPIFLRAGISAAQKLAPFPLETYLKAHFTKVGAQTRVLLNSVIEKGRAHQLAVTHLESLLGQLPQTSP